MVESNQSHASSRHHSATDPDEIQIPVEVIEVENGQIPADILEEIAKEIEGGGEFIRYDVTNRPYYQPTSYTTTDRVTTRSQPQKLEKVPPALPSAKFGSHPQTCNCPNCGATVTTRIIREPGTGTYCLAGLCCLFGLWCGCQLIPFYVDDCKDVKHYCPICNSYLGKKRLI